MPVKLNSSGGGSVTIDVPSTASAFTLTAPTYTANIITSKTPGTVLQVVSTTTSTSTSLTNISTWTDITNLTVSITPSSTSNKILVLASAQYEIFRSAIEAAGALKIVRNSTDIFAQYNNSLGLEAGLSTGSRIYFDGQWNGMVLDSPATTSSVTYKIQGYNTQNANSGRIVVNAQTNNQSSITVMEIAG